MLTVSALAVGVPLGLVANRFAWRAFTGRFGVAPATMTPVGLIAAGAAVTVALGLALASAAGFRAPRYARERPFAT
jgi:hypothetical protein